MALQSDIPESATPYVHPTTKQCNYSVSIIDNLTSSSTTAALSANQGRLLDQKIAELETKIEESAAPIIIDSGSIDTHRTKEASVKACDYVVLTFSEASSREYICTPGASVEMIGIGGFYVVTVSLNSAGTKLSVINDGDSDPVINWVAYG